MATATSAELNLPIRTLEQAQADIAAARIKEYQHRWRLEGWIVCDSCQGTGTLLYHHHWEKEWEDECEDCHGEGGKFLSFEDWLDREGIEI